MAQTNCYVTKNETTFAGGLVFDFIRISAPHTEQSSQLLAGVNDGNAQFLPNLAAAVDWAHSTEPQKNPETAHSGRSSVRQAKLGVSDWVQVPIE